MTKKILNKVDKNLHDQIHEEMLNIEYKEILNHPRAKIINEINFGHENLNDFEIYKFNEDINKDEIIGRPPIQDLDKDGFVDGMDVYQVYTGDDRELFLKNKSGKKIYSDDTSKQWDAVKCFMAEPEGLIYTLIEGAKKKNGKFKVWFSDIDNGHLFGQQKWTSENKMVKEGWEEIFDYDINDNGVIGS